MCLVTQRLFNRSGWPLLSSWHQLTAHRLQARDVTCSLSATPRVVYDFLFILIAHLLMAEFWSESAVLESQMTGYNCLCVQNWGKPQKHSFARNDDVKPWNFGMLVSHLKTSHWWEQSVEPFAVADVPLGECRMVGSVPFYETAGDKSGAILALSTKYREKRGMTDMYSTITTVAFNFLPKFRPILGLKPPPLHCTWVKTWSTTKTSYKPIFSTTLGNLTW